MKLEQLDTEQRAFTKQKLSFSTLNIKEVGFVFVYLSYDNDSNNWVYFDDLKVSHTKSNVLQYNEYYPFGMQASTSWTREDNVNDFLYNGGSELNQQSDWYETFLRGYDPMLGRFSQVDPMASKYSSHSPYTYAFNDPVFWNDPTGADAWDVFWKIVATLWDQASEGGDQGSGGGGGATWSETGGYTGYYGSAVAAQFAIDYNTQFNSWGETDPKSEEGFRSAFEKTSTDAKLLRVLTIITNAYGEYRGEPYSNPNWLNSRIDMVQDVQTQNCPTCPGNDGPWIRNLPGTPFPPQNGPDRLSGSTIANGAFTLTVGLGKTGYKEILRQNVINNSLRKPGVGLDATLRVPGAIKFVANYGGYAFGAYDFGVAVNDYRQDKISGAQAGVQMGNAVIGSIPYMGIGTAWTIGWNAGVHFGPSHWYGSDNTKWFKK